MRAILLHRLTRLLLALSYATATVIAAISPLSACPTLDRPSHNARSQGANHGHHHHDHDSRSHSGDCLNCCMGTCLPSVSLAPPAEDAASPGVDGMVVIYACEQSVLTDRAIPPATDPPKPTA